MKRFLVNHLVDAIIKYKKIVILITIILCVLSVISIISFTKVDLSMKGMAGYRIKEVNQFNNVIEEFNVSGISMVLISPNGDLKNKILAKHEEINQTIHKEIIKDGSNISKVLSIFKEFYQKERVKTFSTQTTIYISIEMLNILNTQKRAEIINNLKSISKSNKNSIIQNFEHQYNEDKINLYKILQLLSYDDMVYFFSQVDTLNTEQKEKISKIIIDYLSIKDKKRFISRKDLFNEKKKEELKDIINSIDNEIESLQSKFNQYIDNYSEDLERILLSDRKADLSVTKNPLLYSLQGEANIEKQKVLNGIFASILHSKDLSYSDKGLMYLIMVIPENDISIPSNSRIFTINLDIILNELKEKYKEDLNIMRTGWPIVSADEEKTILNGFIPMSIITLVGILLIFLIGLKRLIYPLLSMIPLLIGVLLMFGIYSATIQMINIITIISPVILFGIGIDYAIHIGARYGEVRAELGKDASQREVLKRTFNSIGAGLTIGAITTICSFLALISSLIVSFTHLAVMAASGVLCSFLSMVYILPIIITWRERKYDKVDKDFLNSKKLTTLGRLVNSPLGSIIAIIIIVFGLCSFFLLHRIEVEINKDSLLPQHLESVKASKIMGEKFNTSFAQNLFIIDGYDNLIKFEREVNKKDENKRDLYPTFNTDNIINARKSIREFEKLGWRRNIENLDDYINNGSNNSNFFGSSNEDILKYHEFFVRNYVNWDEDRYLVILTPSGYVWQRDFFKRHLKEIKVFEKNYTESIKQDKKEKLNDLVNKLEKIKEQKPDSEKVEKLNSQIQDLKLNINNIEKNDEPLVEGAGLVKIWGFLTTNMIRDLFVSSIIAFSVILFILIISTRSIKGTLICALSLLIAMVSTLSVLGLFRIKLNFVNILAFPIIIGLGIDYSVHIYYRLMEEKGLDIVLVLSSTGKSVLLTTLTTLMAFSSISFSSHPGLASLGQLAVIGLSFAFITSIFVIPFLVKIFHKK